MGIFLSLDLAQSVNFVLPRFKIKTLKSISLFKVGLLSLPLGA